MTDDTITKLGKLLGSGEGRDAVHIAVAPVVSDYGFYLSPAEGLSFVRGSQELVIPCAAFGELVGIVDPYLTDRVFKGQRFWMFLMPATITSLRHVWTHPAFAEASPVNNILVKSQAESWLREFIYQAGDVSYETVIATALAGPDHSYDRDALCFGDEISGNIPDEFWDNIEIITGRPMKWRPSHFRCAC